MNDPDIRQSIEPKSDQLNADDLLGGPITVTVTSVKRGPNADQPIDIGIEGHRPFRPCKSMRRVLVACWGDQGADWVGRSMTLYCDPAVKFGGVAVGGIRISNLSHIDAPRSLMLTVARSKRALYLVGALGVLDATDPSDTVTAERAANIRALLDECPADTEANMLRWQKVGSVEDIPAAQYATIVMNLEKKRAQA